MGALRTSVSNHWFEEVGSAHGHELDHGVALVGAEFTESLEHEVKAA